MKPHNAWVLFYNGDEPFSQALNKLVLGPTTLDCGMVSAVAKWFGIRYVFGDEWCDRVFPFKKLPVIFTQKWQLPMSEDLTVGNLLYDFYDPYTVETSDAASETQTSIQVRTIFNYPLYQAKHPAGVARLQNMIQIGLECVVFDPLGPSIMSLEELDHSMWEDFNNEQTPADIEEIELFKARPDIIDTRRGSMMWRDLAEVAGLLANRTLTKSEWDESVMKRTKQAQNLRLVFNVERLIECVTDAINMGLDDNVEGEVFRIARKRNKNQIVRNENIIFRTVLTL